MKKYIIRKTMCGMLATMVIWVNAPFTHALDKNVENGVRQAGADANCLLNENENCNDKKIIGGGIAVHPGVNVAGKVPNQLLPNKQEEGYTELPPIIETYKVKRIISFQTPGNLIKLKEDVIQEVVITRIRTSTGITPWSSATLNKVVAEDIPGYEIVGAREIASLTISSPHSDGNPTRTAPGRVIKEKIIYKKLKEPERFIGYAKLIDNGAGKTEQTQFTLNTEDKEYKETLKKGQKFRVKPIEVVGLTCEVSGRVGNEEVNNSNYKEKPLSTEDDFITFNYIEETKVYGGGRPYEEVKDDEIFFIPKKFSHTFSLNLINEEKAKKTDSSTQTEQPNKKDSNTQVEKLSKKDSATQVEKPTTSTIVTQTNPSTTTTTKPKPQPKKVSNQVINHNPNWQQALRKHNEFINKTNTKTKTSLPNTGYKNIKILGLPLLAMGLVLFLKRNQK